MTQASPGGCASRMLHGYAESPAVVGTADLAQPTPCYLCGCKVILGMDRLRWTGAQFTDQNKARVYDSPVVCEHCVWACSWVAPPGLRGEGARGPRLSQYTHLCDSRGWRWHTKAEKPAIREWLRSPKQGAWLAAIADSGKKHLLPWTPVNHAGVGLVRFEESNVLLGAWNLVDHMTALLTAGVRKAEIETLNFDPRTLAAHSILVREFCDRWRREHGGRWYALALWLAQKEEA